MGATRGRGVINPSETFHVVRLSTIIKLEGRRKEGRRPKDFSQIKNTKKENIFNLEQNATLGTEACVLLLFIQVGLKKIKNTVVLSASNDIYTFISETLSCT